MQVSPPRDILQLPGLSLLPPGSLWGVGVGEKLFPLFVDLLVCFLAPSLEPPSFPLVNVSCRRAGVDSSPLYPQHLE